MNKNIAMKLEGQHSLSVISPPSSITIMMPNGADKVMRITKEGVWVNPKMPVDAAANAVIGVLDQHIKALVKREETQRDELLNALEAIIERWDTPLWKDAPPAVKYIDAARLIVAKVKGE